MAPERRIIRPRAITPTQPQTEPNKVHLGVAGADQQNLGDAEVEVEAPLSQALRFHPGRRKSRLPSVPRVDPPERRSSAVPRPSLAGRDLIEGARVSRSEPPVYVQDAGIAN
jgi:hypothetical protein